jgi:hypothetical protein
VFTILLTFIGIGLKANSYREGDYVLIGTAIIGAIGYIWGIIDVSSRNDLKPEQKKFWLILVIAIPVAGAMLFYVMHQKRGKLVT